MSEIRAFPVPKKSVALWWLGQTGYIFKTHEGTLLTTDMYLTNSCEAAYSHTGVDLSRRVPILIRPEDLDVDIYTCTHNHQDHTDPETIRGLRHKDTTHFVGPHPSCSVYRAEGIETRPDCARLAGVRARAARHPRARGVRASHRRYRSQPYGLHLHVRRRPEGLRNG